MERGPVVLLGQGEQYADPDDWRELIRARRIRRSVELLVRSDGLTSLRRPEEVPELAVVLDAVDPPGPPSQAAPAASAAAASPGTGVPPTRPSLSDSGPQVEAPDAVASAAPQPGRPLPTAAPRRRWRFGVWRWVFGLGALLLLRLCAQDGFGPLPSFGTRAAGPGERGAEAVASRAEACVRPRGWIARAACDDPRLAALRPKLARAYAARAADLPPDARAALVADQARWQAARGACRTASDRAACLLGRYRPRLAELQRSPPGPAAAAVDRGDGPAPGVRPLSVVERPDWVRRPGADAFADVHPERALRLDIDGRALLACRATASGALTACDVVSEDPTDYGFGEAALRLSRFYRMRPRTAEGRPVEGARVDVPVAFRGG